MRIRMEAQELDVPDEWAEAVLKALDTDVVAMTVRRDDQPGLTYRFEVPLKFTAASGREGRTNSEDA